VAFIKHESFAEDGLVELHTNLVKDLADRMSPMALVTILQATADQILDEASAIAFLEGPHGIEKVKAAPLAVAGLKTTIAALKMGLGNTEAAEALLKECEAMLNVQNGVTPTHVAYYRVTAMLMQQKMDFAGYYTEALRFLGCVELVDLSVEEQAGRAFDLGLAALLGKGIYNVGELLAHPILDTLRDTDKQWLVDLLYAFNSGNVNSFESTKPMWSSKSPDLAANEALLLEKFQLLAVMEAVFQRGTTERTIPFATLAEVTQVPANKIEYLVMKALSKGLVKGTINQIEEVVEFSWVEPRVLDMDQLGKMRDRLGDWLEAVKAGANMVQLGEPVGA
jgi:26S proteasome regulatory subunit N9